MVGLCLGKTRSGQNIVGVEFQISMMVVVGEGKGREGRQGGVEGPAKETRTIREIKDCMPEGYR